jgi:Spy/CpxP family protein refolding chaperone
MKKYLPLTLTLCGAACLLAVSAHAANPPVPAQAAAPSAESRPGDKFAGLVAERLGLTAEQQAKLDSLRQTQRAALDAVVQDKTLSPEDRRAKVRGLMESNREQMKAVLTPEQQSKMALAREHFMGGRPGGPEGQRRFGPGGPGPGPQRFGQQRSDGRNKWQQGKRGHQQAKMHQKAKHHREQRGEALGLTDDQRAKMRLIAFQHREKAIALQKDMRTEMESVLTPEQKAKAQDLKAQHVRPGPGHRPEGGRMGPPPGN